MRVCVVHLEDTIISDARLYIYNKRAGGNWLEKVFIPGLLLEMHFDDLKEASKQ